MSNIIFDVDGTLWDSTAVVARAWSRAAAEEGKTAAVINAAVLKKEFGKTMKVIADNLFSDVDEASRTRLMETCCRYEHEELEAETADLLYPEVAETLKQLAAAHRLFIVSNCQSGYIELFLKKSGLTPYVEDWECFGGTGLPKGENIRLLMKRNHLGSAVYVGDTQGDYEATQVAGVPFIFARYGFGCVEGVPAIDGIRELLELV